mgnify:CR=1 FL=1
MITRYEQFLNEASKDFRANIPINASTITSLLGYKDCFNKVVSIQYEALVKWLMVLLINYANRYLSRDAKYHEEIA